MNQPDNVLNEIESNEAWARLVWRESPGPDRELLRQVVRCALDEAWLSEKLRGQSAGRAEWAARRGVDQALRTTQTPPAAAPRRRPMARRVIRWCAGITSAAAVAALWLWSVSAPFTGSTEASLGEEFMSAFTAYAEDTITVEAAEIDDELSTIEFGMDGMAWNAQETGWYDNLLHAVEEADDDLKDLDRDSLLEGA